MPFGVGRSLCSGVFDLPYYHLDVGPGLDQILVYIWPAQAPEMNCVITTNILRVPEGGRQINL